MLKVFSFISELSHCWRFQYTCCKSSCFWAPFDALSVWHHTGLYYYIVIFCCYCRIFLEKAPVNSFLFARVVNGDAFYRRGWGWPVTGSNYCPRKKSKKNTKMTPQPFVLVIWDKGLSTKSVTHTWRKIFVLDLFESNDCEFFRVIKSCIFRGKLLCCRCQTWDVSLEFLDKPCWYYWKLSYS